MTRLQFARAIQGSGAIDGLEALLDDATAIDLGELPIDTDDETRLTLKGYRDALTYVGYLAADNDFTYSGQLLRSLHFIMGSYDDKDRPGRWRVGPVVESDVLGVETSYVRPDASDVPALMSEFVEALQSSDGSPPLVRAAIAHLNVVAIQPFESGNGRLGRCLHTLVLARQGVLPPAFGSIEEYLGRNALAYAESLGDVTAGYFQPDRDTRPWVRFMLTAHLLQAKTVKRRVNESELLWDRLEKVAKTHGLPDRSVVALFDAALGLRVRSTTYRSAIDQTFFEEITEATASRDLRQSADAGLLEAVGEKRGRHYRATSEVGALRQTITSERKKKDWPDPFAKRDKRD
ncbi:MAG TPA: Fic family protein [Acidimicrobiales bacterium]|nr:Fic family protein [Acidimicrobiales bacterium]